MASPFAKGGTSNQTAIELDLSDDEITGSSATLKAEYDVNIIDISDDETLDEENEEKSIRDLTPFGARPPERYLDRPRGLPFGHRDKDFVVTSAGHKIKPRTCVEMQIGKYEFFYIIRVIQDLLNNTFLDGVPMERNRDINKAFSRTTGRPRHAWLPMPKNDVCMIMRTTPGSTGSILDDKCLVRVPLEHAGLPREIVLTNHQTPAFNYFEQGLSAKTYEEGLYVEEHGKLCCRDKFVEAFDLKTRKVVGWELVWLDPDECDEGKSRSPMVMRKGYGSPTKQSLPKKEATKHRIKSRITARMENLKFATATGSKLKRKYEAAVDEEIQFLERKGIYKRRTVSTVEDTITTSASFDFRQPSPLVKLGDDTARPRKRKYTIADALAGMGAVARAAVMCELDLRWVLDKEPVAIATLHKNFPLERHPKIRHLEKEIQDFVGKGKYDAQYAADIIHVSYPCQGHSPLNHNQNIEKDAENNVCVCSLGNLLSKCRPRILTLEQTRGITSRNEGTFFRMIIHDIKSAGYNVKQTVLNPADWGNPSARRRCMVMASCPGEPLPPWPSPTHGPGLKPYVTVNEAIRGIPANATWHDIAGHKLKHRHSPKKWPVMDGNEPLPRIIATRGVEFLHPSGQYWPTYRQQMRLQTIPDEHELTGATQLQLTTQIGNAVPVVMMQAIFTEIIKSLEKSDREAEAQRQDFITLD